MEQKWTYGLRSRRSIGTYDHRLVVTSIKSETMAQQRAEAAIVAAFTPICVDKFRAAPDAEWQSSPS